MYFFCKRQTWFTEVKNNSDLISQKSVGGMGLKLPSSTPWAVPETDFEFMVTVSVK